MRRYRIVESSARLREVQEKRLRWSPVHWHNTMHEALAAAEGRALVFSNELIDAFPCCVLEWTGERWEEVILKWNGRAFEERLERPTAERTKELQEAAIELPPGTRRGDRREVHLSVWRWLRSWIPLWSEGALLTIDYGEPAEILAAQKPSGTLRAYFNHMRLEGEEIYRRAGTQDITADVNFTDLQRWNESFGCATEFLCTQAEFLQRYADLDENDDLTAFLTRPHGAGSAFKALCQRKRAKILPSRAALLASGTRDRI
jgi:SAM-dependent MidA family methyltransferase